MSGWLKRRWYDLVFHTSFWLFLLFWSLRVRGRSNIPANGPVLLMSNHQSFFDPVLIGVASPRYNSPLARKTLFANRWFAALIGSLNALPIDREGSGKEGLQAVLTALRDGRAVLMFPEGYRTNDGQLQSLQAGIALLVRRSGVPVVPIGIAGAHAAWPRRQWLPLPAPLILPPSERTLAVVVGPPISAEVFHGLDRDAILSVLTQAMQQQWTHAEHLRMK